MLSTLRARRQQILRGLWFIPGVVTLGFAILALVLVQIDRTAGSSGIDVLFGGSSSAARTILSTVAGSVITVAGLAFSITIITLQLVSQQFSPRVTRTFLGDRPTQLSAGVFLGVFVYCLIVLRAVRGEDFGEFVPALAVAASILLGVLGIGVLLFFINHTAQAIRVTSIAARIARETLSSIDDLYPAQYGEPAEDETPDEAVALWSEEGEALSVGPTRPGYVQRLDLDTFVGRLPAAVERLQVHVAPGEFVTEEQPLVSVWPCDSCDRDELADAVGTAIVVASDREVRDDAAYGVQQLADIALKAISPSVNDPATAVTCVGYVAACLERLAGRAFPATRRRYPEAGIEAVVRRPSFELFVTAGLDDISPWASSSPRVVKALLSAAGRAAAIAAEAGAEDRVALLRRAAERAAEPALADARTEDERVALERALEDASRAGKRRDRPGSRIAAGGHRPW